MPHTDNEYIHISEVEQTRQLCIDIFDTIKEPIEWGNNESRHNYNRFNFSNYQPKKINTSDVNRWNYYDDDFTTDSFKSQEIKSLNDFEYDDIVDCPVCGDKCEKEFDDTVGEYYCYTCQEYIPNNLI